MLFIPEGFAHGFLAMEDSYVLYLTTNEFNNKLDSGIRYDDKQLNSLLFFLILQLQVCPVVLDSTGNEIP